MKKVLGEDVKAATEAQIKGVLKQELSKSKKMIQLFELGLEVKDITELMSDHEGKNVRYNFVYNVVSNYINMNGIQTETTAKEGKKDQIIELMLAGKTNKDISITLKTNYNYVFNTIKGYLKEKKMTDPRKNQPETQAEAQ